MSWILTLMFLCAFSGIAPATDRTSFFENVSPAIQNKIKWNLLLNEIYEYELLSNSKVPISTEAIIKSQNLNVTRQQLAQLQTISTIAEDRKPKVTRSSDKKVTITKTIIRTSALDWSSYITDATEVVEIFASSAIVFDSNVTLNGFYGLVSFIAPLWTVRDQVEINLDAKPAEAVSPSKANIVDGCKYNDTIAANNGVPGNPGNTAGSFLGFYETIEHGQNLKISASGSDGGKGQDGGDGIVGCDGGDAQVKDHLWDCYKNVMKWHCKGEPGYPGGNGGDGGAGGKGGLSGDIQIYNLKNNISIPFDYKAKDGAVGSLGIGGAGGIGGTEGDPGTGDYVLGWYNVKIAEGEGTEVAASGTKGGDGIVTTGLQEPKQTISANPHIEEIINDYRNFTAQTLEDNEFLLQRGYSFFLKLMTNPFFDKYYSPTGIAQEFTNLEEHFYVLNEKIDYLPLYQQLLKHIETAQMTTVTDEDKKVLTFLYTTTLTKLCAMQDVTNQNFIVDLNTFIDICMEDIQQLKNIDAAVTIDETTQTYNSQIDGEISEAKNIIDEHIAPKITQSITKLTTNLKNIMVEISELEHDTEVEQEVLKQAQKSAKNNFITSMILNALKLVGDVCSLMVPAGQVVKYAAAAVDFASNGNQKDVNKIIDDYKDVKDKYTGLVNISKAEMEAKRVILSSNLLEIEAEFNETEEVAEMLQEVDDVRKEIDSFDGSEADMFDMFVDKLNQIVNVTSDKKTVSSQANLLENFLVAIQDSQNQAKILNCSVDIYETFKNDKESMSKLSVMVENNKENVQRIKVLQFSVENTLAPMLTQIGNTLTAIENNLENESTAQLEVTNWGIKDTLNNIKEIIEKYTAGFEVAPEMTDSVDVIMDSMDKMIAIYEKIQSYQNEKKASDYMALVNSAGYRDIIIEDETLQAILDKLEFYVKSNTLLQKYRQSLTQIKQYAFPLAETYFKGIGLPQAIKMESDIETYTQTAISQIKRFKSKLADSNMYLFSYDDVRINAKFYNDSPAGPFFVWSNQTYHDSISKLLAGEEVLFYADPSLQDKNAVKFNVIDIRLISNTNNQEKLNEILQKFKIALTHSGNHYYNCNNKIYIVNTMSEKFLFDFKNNNDDHEYVDMVYSKIDKSNKVMSPYTSWKIKLRGEVEDFELLKVYGEGADLQLVGEGEFYEDKENLCSDTLSDYYQLHSVKQQKTEKCVKTLTNGMIDKEDPCYVGLDEKTKNVYI